MTNPIKYPIGVQSFEKIRNGGYLYVDKTAVMHRLVSNSDCVFLSRPRRFGKSLLMSTLHAYFEGRRDLFKGLAIESLEKEWKRHPVFRADLSTENYNRIERLHDKLNYFISGWESEYGKNKEEVSLSSRFMGVIRRAWQKTGLGAVILIDEYDKPLLENLHDDALHEDLRKELRAFFSVLKESDEYIRFSMLTGVTKFGHLSIFSGLNNLKDISLRDDYNDICGISESEFKRYFQKSITDFSVCHEQEEKSVWQDFKDSYDGYHFSAAGEGIYNPFSVLLAFDSNETGTYWYQTGTPDFLISLLRRQEFPLSELDSQRRTASQLGDISVMNRDIVPLLFQAGYLTINSYDRHTQQYLLRFPNREVREGFWSSLWTNYLCVPLGYSVFDVNNFISDVVKGRPEDFMERLRSLLADTSSETEPDKEIHFQNMMAIIFKMLGLRVRTEVHSARGRTDMTVETDGYIYIFEFKVNSSAREAITQIYERGYAEPYKADRRRKFLIGASFSTKERTLSEWIIE